MRMHLILDTIAPKMHPPSLGPRRTRTRSSQAPSFFGFGRRNLGQRFRPRTSGAFRYIGGRSIARNSRPLLASMYRALPPKIDRINSEPAEPMYASHLRVKYLSVNCLKRAVMLIRKGEVDALLWPNTYMGMPGLGHVG